MSMHVGQLKYEKCCTKIYQNTIWSSVISISRASEYLSSKRQETHILLCLCMGT